MSFSLSASRLRRTLAMAAVALTGFAAVQVRGQGEKIHFSDPSGGVSASNLNTSLPADNPFAPPSALKQMQDDLYRPLAESLHNSGSMDGVFSVPVPPQQSQAPLSRHAREMLDRRLNWAFSDFDQLNENPASDDILGSFRLDNDDSSEPASLVNRYFDKVDKAAKKAGTKKNPAAVDDPLDPSNELIRRYDPDSLTGASEKNFVNDLFSTKPNQNKSNSGNFGNPAIQQNSGLENPLVAERRLADFRRYSLMDPSAPPPKSESSMSAVYFDQLGSTYGAADAAAKPPAAAEPHHSVLYRSPLFPDTAAALHSAVYDDPTAAALGLNNPAPAAAPPKPPVTAQSVQNLLNPFAAVVKKPNF